MNDDRVATFAAGALFDGPERPAGPGRPEGRRFFATAVLILLGFSAKITLQFYCCCEARPSGPLGPSGPSGLWLRKSAVLLSPALGLTED